jgi:uncharacterized membrane protein YbhN (UPF0104 family)
MPIRSRVRALSPWIVGLLLLAVVLWRVPVSETLQAVRLARLEVFLPLLTFACLAWFLIDAFAFKSLFGRFNTPLSFPEARELRALSYLATPIHWNVGRAAVIARLRARHQVPILEATSSMALYQTLDALLVTLLCALGLSQIGESDGFSTSAIFAAMLGGALVGYLALLRVHRRLPAPLDRLRAPSLHRSHRLATTRDLALLLALRLAYFVVLIAVYSAGTAAFGVELPLPLVIASVPIIQAIGALPISPAGLGTQQAAMLYLFAGYGPDAAILAFGLSYPLLCIVLRSLIGSVYLGRLARPSRSASDTPDASRAVVTAGLEG